MLLLELSFMLLYVSAFGFSDYIVQTFRLTSWRYLLYYGVLFVLGMVGVWMVNGGEKSVVDKQ